MRVASAGHPRTEGSAVKYLLLVAGLARLIGYATDPLLDADQIHAVVGEPDRFQGPPADGGQLKVVSWNIAQGAQYEEVRDALMALDADIYLLQEVDMHVRRSDYREVAKHLADDMGLNWVFAGEFQEIGLSRRNIPALTGQAVLSRYPITDAVALRFRNQANLRWRLDPTQPRRGGRMALRVESAGVTFYNAHIESAKNDTFRHKQIDELLDDRARAVAPHEPVMFAGDFNTGQLPHRSPIVQCLTREGFIDALGEYAHPRRTSVRHDQPLDWMFVHNMSADFGEVIEVAEASDHFPLTASISLRASFTVASAGLD
jgi:endonuclease/exonuclease/phosphatase family metal-dependent hydrolase